MGSPLITLTTDFGTQDSYVAEMKGVMLQLNPQATIVDISHHVGPQRVAQGAFVLGTAYRSFPRETIHLAVVDPGVGTFRRAVLLVTAEGRFLDQMEIAVPAGCAAYGVSNPGLWRNTVSDTFHGRDTFAPVAAHLSLGTPPEEVGEPLESMTCLYIPHPQMEGNTIAGHVIHLDGFGNLITTIGGKSLPHDRVEVRLGGHRISGVSRSYAEGEDVLSIIGSHGNLEIAVRNGSAEREMNATVGDQVVVELLPLG